MTEFITELIYNKTKINVVFQQIFLTKVETADDSFITSGHMKTIRPIVNYMFKLIVSAILCSLTSV